MVFAGDRPLMALISRVGEKLRSFDPRDTRLPLLREYYQRARESLPPPPGLSQGWLEEWEALLGLGKKPLRERSAGQPCDRCDSKGMPFTGPEVAGYGFRATCTQCGEAWVVRFTR